MTAAKHQNQPQMPTQTDAHFRTRVLEMLVDGAPLHQILEALLLGFEALRPGALCSVMLLDAPGKTIAQAIGPSLPDFYCAALIGLAIGPGTGSCGTAAYSGERVIVEDIATHPFWAPYKELAAQADLAACWSQPIVAASGRVLGTFAIYYRNQRAPDATDLELIQQSAALACVAIEKDAEAQKLRDSEERYRTLVEWSPDPVLVHRLGTILYVNPSAIKAFGAQQASDLVGRQTSTLIHPDFLEQQVTRMQALLRKAPMAAMAESRFLRIDGTPFDVEVQGTPIAYQGSPAIHVVLRDITQRKQAQAALQESQERFRALVEFLPTAVIVHQDLLVVYANPAAVSTLGAPNVEALMGRSIMDITHPDYRQQVAQRLKSRQADGIDLPVVELKLLQCDGSVIDVQMNATRIHFGGAMAVQASFNDITARKLAEERLQLAAKVFSHAREGIVITDSATRILDVNTTYSTITGFSRAEALGTQAHIFKSGGHSETYYKAMWQGLHDQGHWSGEIWSKRKDGEAYAELITISAVKDGMDRVRNYVILLVDITPMKTYQRQLESMAHFDALTQLPNRQLLQDRLHQAMSQAQRRRQALAVVFVDLDGFKAVNDQHGHAVGDSLLVVLAQRMKGALRDGDTLARIGGDEFVAVLVDLNHSEDADPVLERLLQAAADPVIVGETVLRVSASMGIALFPRDGTHADLLLRRADQSMYLAKQAGRNRYQFFGAQGNAKPQAGDGSSHDTIDRQA
jgi:diguanylate cyclase (GGDEF)-like protein/PAS domain S-box-containing protein